MKTAGAKGAGRFHCQTLVNWVFVTSLLYAKVLSIVLVAKRLTLRFAKPSYVGSTPTQDSRV